MTATTVAEPNVGTANAHSKVKTISAAALGTVFEWYEFTLYAAMAGILAAKFFSGLDPSVGFFFALLTFGVGFVVRPFGALFFGRLGDMIGRKRTFMITLLIMGLATCAVGLLPTYATAGIAAPILLISLRILQGLALGGEYGGAVIYVTEHVPKNRRGLSTAFIQMTGTLGFLLGLIVIQSTQAIFGAREFDEWAWRLPFILSIGMLGVSIAIRLNMKESPVFKKMADERRLSSAPVRETFGSAKNLKLLAVALIGIGGGMSVVYYNAVTYPLFFLTKTLAVPMGTANTIVGVAAFCAIPMIWFAGWLSDHIGRKPVILAGFTLGLAAAFPIYHQIAAVANPALAAAQERTPIVIHADPATCSFMLNPLGNRKFSAPCDVARQSLTAVSANYTFESRSGSETEVRIGNQVMVVNSTVNYDALAFAKQVTGAAKQAGFGVAGNPDVAAQASIVGLLLVLLFAMALGYAPVGVAMAEMFPARIRYTAMSFPYHFSSGWVGGLLPTFAFAIAVAQGNIFAGLWYTVFWLVVGIAITAVFYREPVNVED